MHTYFIQYVSLILIILALVMLANKMRVAYPIVLVLGGLALSFTTRFSSITIDPEQVFFIFLPNCWSAPAQGVGRDEPFK